MTNNENPEATSASRKEKTDSVGIESAKSKNRDIGVDYQYTVALSFAGTDRKLAESVAEILRKNNVTVFYDRYEEHELWGRNLHEVLQDVYTRKCQYCVMFLSPSYLSRMWPVFERQQI